MTGSARDRARHVVTGVLRDALREFHAGALIVLRPLTPEGSLLLRWCEMADLNAEAADASPYGGVQGLDDEELERAVARSNARHVGALVVHPVNRTALLLAAPPPEDVLPMGDVPASAIAAWAGEWSSPEAVRELADAAGGIERLDAALYAWLERREDESSAFEGIDATAADGIRSRFRRDRAARRRAGLVPKLGWRTVGHDLRY